MLNVHCFVFNDFQVNTYVLETGGEECLIIDCGCQYPNEWATLKKFLVDKALKPIDSVHTHFHIDHMQGYPFLYEEYGIGYKVHPSSKLFIDLASEFASVFGIKLGKIYPPTGFLEEGDILRLGEISLEVIYTPGHADGSVCFYSKEEGILFTGDVLFRDSIGRTDLPTGNFDKLKDSIVRKLFVLPPDTLVYPGHGPSTTLGYEMANNPFI
ncbi:MAG: hydroxyacylglutathione hydrolase [Bacteroidales bacterium]|jgi:glyoxylase-like metal-dependent hydrolase (beta-lactamase superfamily II)|nr:hydroxyacylglutathione hydrolase [Bacteroidales bacterium]MDN5330671.1 hydroxyacylglutathione hydrolase [Bacteroidales bacterium]NLH52656.1 MBL fold metallo-hydrolase [Bacteroidales bacterium]NPV36970.1 MBL fold metallo-hydrolase [Bacteroidales bacterium]